MLATITPGADGFTFIKQFTDFGLKEKIKIVALASDENYLMALTPDQSEVISAEYRSDSKKIVCHFGFLAQPACYLWVYPEFPTG